MTDEERHIAALEDLMLVVVANAGGQVVKRYNVVTDRFDWVYGSARIPDTHDLRIRLGVTEADKSVSWDALREALLLKWRNEAAQRSHA